MTGKANESKFRDCFKSIKFLVLLSVTIGFLSYGASEAFAVPSPITDLSIDSTDIGSVSLSWTESAVTAPPTGLTGIVRSVNFGPLTLIGTVPSLGAGATQVFADTTGGLVVGDSVFYFVQQLDRSCRGGPGPGECPFSNTVVGTITGDPVDKECREEEGGSDESEDFDDWDGSENSAESQNSDSSDGSACNDDSDRSDGSNSSDGSSSS